MKLSPSDLGFLGGPFQQIGGWCHDEAAWMTAHLMRLQQAAGHAAPAFEIGVYKGKYLSVLRHCAAGEVYGLDTFEWVPRELVEETLRSALGNLEGLHLVTADSTRLDAAELLRIIGGRKAGFISIDGAHTPDAVYSDLRNGEAVLEPWGLVALDDFFNRSAIGVTEGAFRYWHGGGARLTPLAYCQNKLFLSFPDFADGYTRAIAEFCEQNQELPAFRGMVDRRSRDGVHAVKQELMGRDIWII